MSTLTVESGPSVGVAEIIVEHYWLTRELQHLDSTRTRLTERIETLRGIIDASRTEFIQTKRRRAR